MAKKRAEFRPNAYLPKGESYFLPSPDIDAFAVRGESHVFIHDGLLRQYVAWCIKNGETVTEDAFAFVLAHEFGHVKQGTQELDPLEEESEEKKKEQSGSDELKRKHQEHLNDEYDADRFAIQTIARAGYNPREGLKMLRFLWSLNNGTALPTTHPRSEDRLRELIALVESPDTIIQNTDKASTKLSAELVRELSEEDPHRPGTTLYREKGRKHLGDLVAKAETMSDALEVVQVAQMHRQFEGIDRLRKAEAVRTGYAKWIVAENIKGLLTTLQLTYTGSGFSYSNQVVESFNLPTQATRYAMREYKYDQAARPLNEGGERVSANIASDFGRMADGAMANILQYIDQQLNQEIPKLRSQISSMSPLQKRYEEYQTKLEYLRGHVAATVQAVDHSVLNDLVRNVKLDAKTEWSQDVMARTWLKDATPGEMLEWCAHNGTALFSYLAHPMDAQMQQALGDIVGADSRYQGYLPAKLTAQEDFFTEEGRAAFIEQSIFAHTEESLKRNASSMRGLKDAFLASTTQIPERFAEALSVKLETRYASLSVATELSEAVSRALLSDGDFAEWAVEDVARDFSRSDTRVWLTKIQPMLVGYCSSANALFLAETGIGRKAAETLTTGVYAKLYRLEQRCSQVIQRSLDEAKDVSMNDAVQDRLAKAISFGDGHVRYP